MSWSLDGHPRRSAGELPPDLPPAGLGLLPGNGDEYIVTGGGLIGQRGFLTRDADGTNIGADMAGRLFTRSRHPPSDTWEPDHGQCPPC
ncbi:hypothetical protein DN069_01035 [Streptacidiphilus pinicola]|uniref:Uncharacterized protein n=1 Tax=Streptacidiphilus pinicola TaxID=2219663 RepID=A0A2X0IQF7_9ACTN|nr:hypothetical protein DN069_01035 [Streptacidiphilus pinicola]